MVVGSVYLLRETDTIIQHKKYTIIKRNGVNSNSTLYTLCTKKGIVLANFRINPHFIERYNERISAVEEDTLLDIFCNLYEGRGGYTNDSNIEYPLKNKCHIIIKYKRDSRGLYNFITCWKKYKCQALNLKTISSISNVENGFNEKVKQVVTNMYIRLLNRFHRLSFK